jgi:hypothetical protein
LDCKLMTEVWEALVEQREDRAAPGVVSAGRMGRRWPAKGTTGSSWDQTGCPSEAGLNARAAQQELGPQRDRVVPTHRKGRHFLPHLSVHLALAGLGRKPGVQGP